MACACKVNQQINYLQNTYGVTKESKKTNIRGSVGLLLKKILVGTIAIALAPLMLVILIIRLIMGKRVIKINELLKKNVKK